MTSATIDHAASLRRFAARVWAPHLNYVHSDGAKSVLGFFDALGDSHTLQLTITGKTATFHFDRVRFHSDTGMQYLPSSPAEYTCPVEDLDECLIRLAHHYHSGRVLSGVANPNYLPSASLPAK